MFGKKDRATFKYTFAHWCAYNMTALNLGVWKIKYLLHDVEKPFLKLLFKDYNVAQKWHREHNKHHMEWFLNHGVCDFDAMVIDYECSRFTKLAAQRNAMEEFQRQVLKQIMRKTSPELLANYYTGMRIALKKATLWNDMKDPYNAFDDKTKELIIKHN